MPGHRPDPGKWKRSYESFQIEFGANDRYLHSKPGYPEVRGRVSSALLALDAFIRDEIRLYGELCSRATPIFAAGTGGKNITLFPEC